MGLILQAKRRVLTLAGRGARGARGPTGAPGGNILAIGLFVNTSGMTIPSGTQVVETSGYRTLGMGRGRYVQDDAKVTPSYASAHPAWAFRAVDENGAAHGWRLIPNEDGRVHFDTFGAYRDGRNLVNGTDNGAAHDDYPAWAALTDFWSETLTATSTHPYYRNLVPVNFGIGAHRFNSRPEVKLGSAALYGAGTSGELLGGAGTIFQFASGVGGLIVQDAGTEGEGGSPPVSPNGRGAYGTIIENIHFTSMGGTPDNHFGLWVRTNSRLRNLIATQWHGDGFVFWGVPGASGAAAGGPDSTFAENLLSAFNNGAGLRVEGSEANAGTFINVQCNNNGTWGIVDKSGLANTYVGGQVDGNGYAGAGRSSGEGASAAGSVCTHNGGWWGVVYGQEAAASTTEPGTNPNVWYYHGDSGTAAPMVPAWVSGMTWKSGGAALFTSESAPCMVSGLYAEEGQGRIQNAGGRALIFGGLAAQWVLEGIGSITTREGQLVTGGAIGVQTHDRHKGASSAIGEVLATLGDPREPRRVMRVGASGLFGDAGPTFDFDDAYHNWLMWRLNGGDPFLAFVLAGQTFAFGRSAPVADPSVYIPRFFTGSAPTNARQIDFDEAAPTAGAHARGDIVFNVNAGAGGKAGWYCTAAGTPGTWKAFGAIDA